MPKKIDEAFAHTQQELTIIEKQLEKNRKAEFIPIAGEDISWGRNQFEKNKQNEISHYASCHRYVKTCASKISLLERYLTIPELIIAANINDALENPSQHLHKEIEDERELLQRSSTDGVALTLAQLVAQTMELLSLSPTKKSPEKNTKEKTPLEKEQTIEKNLAELAKYEKLSSLIRNYGTLCRISLLTKTVMEMHSEKEQKGIKDTTNFFFLEMLALLDKIEPSKKNNPPKKGFLSNLFSSAPLPISPLEEFAKKTRELIALLNIKPMAKKPLSPS